MLEKACTGERGGERGERALQMYLAALQSTKIHQAECLWLGPPAKILHYGGVESYTVIETQVSEESVWTVKA